MATPPKTVGRYDIIEMVGTDRIMANSAGDWGKSDPLAVPELIQEMKRRGHPEAAVRVDETACPVERVGEDEIWIPDGFGQNVPEPAGWRSVGEIDHEPRNDRPCPAASNPAPGDCGGENGESRRLD